MWPFSKKRQLSQAEIVRRRSNFIISVSVALLVSVMFGLFLFEIKNEPLASLIVAIFGVIVVAAMIADADEIKLGPIEIKRKKKEGKDDGL